MASETNEKTTVVTSEAEEKGAGQQRRAGTIEYVDYVRRYGFIRGDHNGQLVYFSMDEVKNAAQPPLVDGESRIDGDASSILEYVCGANYLQVPVEFHQAIIDMFQSNVALQQECTRLRSAKQQPPSKKRKTRAKNS